MIRIKARCFACKKMGDWYPFVLDGIFDCICVRDRIAYPDKSNAFVIDPSGLKELLSKYEELYLSALDLVRDIENVRKFQKRVGDERSNNLGVSEPVIDSFINKTREIERKAYASSKG